ncbi:hypothetical protein JW899_01995 [Candidatus Uhrbacteria bacterium]|nr:hypothetical protein [Candidatus Uhrbacteria bacterium]
MTIGNRKISGKLAGIKTVILVDRNSASASEMLAGALRDYGLAVIVGETSYGKASKQTSFDLGAAGQVKLTTSRWLTPMGTDLNDIGIVPDIEITIDDVSAIAETVHELISK